jgi:prevent-host-death family protein
MVIFVSTRITATRFKAECLGLLDRVAATGEELVVTKHGKPVARVVPPSAPRSLRGTVTYNLDEDELIAPLGDPWSAEE